MENKEFHKIELNIPKITPMVKLLIIVNVLIFFIDHIFGILGIADKLIWEFNSIIKYFEFWRLMTYSFVHLELTALLINMLVLWLFGSELENKWGGNFFLKYYFGTILLTGLAALPFAAISYNYPLWGANAAALSLLAAYAVNYPDMIVYFMFVIPMKIKWLVCLIAGINILTIKPAQPQNLMYLSHLSGIIFGLIILKVAIFIDTIKFTFFTKNIFKENLKRHKKNQIYKKDNEGVKVYSITDFKSMSIDKQDKHNNNIKIIKSTPANKSPEKQIEQQENMDLHKKVDDILDKINKNGMESLNAEEHAILKSASNLLKKQYLDQNNKK